MLETPTQVFVFFVDRYFSSALAGELEESPWYRDQSVVELCAAASCSPRMSI